MKSPRKTRSLGVLAASALLAGFALAVSGLAAVPVPAKPALTDAHKPGTPPAAKPAGPAPVQASPSAPDLLREFAEGPMKGVDEIVFTTREIIGEHWYANIGYYSNDRNRPLYRKGGRLCKWNVRTGKLTVLLEDKEGGMRDCCVHYDGRRILFSYRKGGTETYHLCLIDSDGRNFKQLTDGIYDDFEPCWLPDGGIAFVTTRAKRWVNCWLTQVANIWRCDGEGKNMRPLSANLEQDNTPWVLPDGRMLYTRWEYVDRSQVHYHHLWIMNPDGTSQMVYFGNFHPGGVYIDAKPIPGSNNIVMSRSPGHGQTEHMGALASVSIKNGPDDLKGMRDLAIGQHYRDPWAFNENTFMVAEENRLVFVNGEGQSTTAFTLPPEYGKVWLHEPRPLVPHERERVIPDRVDLSQSQGRYLVNNVYQGRNMAGVKPGEIKRLMVIESLPKPINFTGGMDPMSYAGTFTMERVLGTVPVEADGSAYFEAPALRSLLFVLLDDRGRSVKRMQSFTTVQPGETFSCLGCHENRSLAPSPVRLLPVAAKRAPSPIEPFKNVPGMPSFTRDIQPILDRHCLKCHDYDKHAGGVILSADRGPMFSHSYYTLTVRKQLADGRNLARSEYPPHILGSGGSPLIDKTEGTHHDVKLDERERLLVRLWIDIGAPYPDTYAALGCGAIGGYICNSQVLNNDKKWPETKAVQPVYNQRCLSCHTEKNPIPASLSDEIDLSFWSPNMNDRRLKSTRHLAFNLTRPEKSLVLLAPLAKSAGGYGLCKPKGAPAGADSTVFATPSDPGYRAILAMCEAGKRKLDEVKRFDMPGFKPRAEYIREMIRFGILPANFDLAKDPIDVWATDRSYWESLQWKPITAGPRE